MSRHEITFFEGNNFRVVNVQKQCALKIIKSVKSHIIGNKSNASVALTIYQIKSNQNQITFIVTSPQHKCLGE